MNLSFHRQPTRLGIASETNDYDLPFRDDRANRFLLLLIGLMTYLAILSAAAGMVLTSMAERWNTGLANHLTIEIPGVDARGQRLTAEQHQERVEQIRAALDRDGLVVDLQVKPPSAVAKLVEPWLGSDQTMLNQVPLPTLVTVMVADGGPNAAAAIQEKLAAIAPDLNVENHQSWLGDVLRLTETLSFAAYLIGFITAITTISAVAGAVRARMTAYHDHLEILHLIGASDFYIARQFQRHSLQLSLAGAGAGFMMAMLSLMALDQLAGSVDLTLVPALILSPRSFLLLLAIPVIVCLITVATTRFTVRQALEEMP
jgi:cell division transport system permease protein